MRKQQILILCILLLSLYNCEKGEGLSVEEKQQKSALTAMDYALADQLFNDLIDLVDEQAKQQPQLSGLPSNGVDTVIRKDCIRVSFKQTGNNIVFPATLTLDFGAGCNLADGRTISGKLIAVFTNELLQQGMQIQIENENLVIDGHSIAGQQTITNEGVNQAGQFKFRIDTKDGLITKTSGRSIEYRGITWRAWIEGDRTNFFQDEIEGIQDDVWEIIGFAEGFNSNNISYSVQMDDPVRRSLGCRWQINGELVVKTGDTRLTTKLKFGPEEEPECDNIVILTAGTFVEEIEL